jgi:dGTPase
LSRPLITFSDELQAQDRQLKAFMFDQVYRHWRINRSTSKAKRVVRDLFGIYTAEPNILPDDWRRLAEHVDEKSRAIAVADFIAGMTDRFAMIEHRRLFDLSEGHR